LQNNLEIVEETEAQAESKAQVIPEVETSPIDPADFNVYVAEIVGAHGVGGNSRVRLIGTPEVALRALQTASQVLAKLPDGSAIRVLKIRSLRRQPGPKGAWVARFSEVKDRLQAEALYSAQLFVKDAERPVLPEGEYYVDDIIGCEVVTDKARPLGKLTDVLSTPANDVYVTDMGAMIPAVASFLVDVDVPNRRIVVTDVPGLIDDPSVKEE